MYEKCRFGCDRRRRKEEKRLIKKFSAQPKKNYRKICFRFNELEKFTTHIRVMSKYVDKLVLSRELRVGVQAALFEIENFAKFLSTTEIAF